MSVIRHGRSSSRLVQNQQQLLYRLLLVVEASC